MTNYSKNGVEISMPHVNKETELKMERCAEFMARMLQKYGQEVMTEIEAKKERDQRMTGKSVSR